MPDDECPTDIWASMTAAEKTQMKEDIQGGVYDHLKFTLDSIQKEKHPSPHAARDKTEEWDMRPKEEIVQGRKDKEEWLKELSLTPSRIKADEEMGEGQDGGGLRMNAGKLRVELLPPEWTWALADVMSQGAKKYEPRNWEKGMGWGTMIGCIQRHILKFQAGERYDGEEFSIQKGTTGCHHMAMAAWNCLALMTYDLRKIGKNDLADEVTLDLLNAVNAATAKIEKEFKI